MITHFLDGLGVRFGRYLLLSLQISVRFVRLNEKARMPAYGSVHAAGADLHASEAAVVPARGKVSYSSELAPTIKPLIRSLLKTSLRLVQTSISRPAVILAAWLDYTFHQATTTV